MCVVAAVGEDKIGIDTLFQRFEPGFDAISLLGEKPIPERPSPRFCAFAAALQEIRRRRPRLPFASPAPLKHAPLDFEANAAVDHAQKRRAYADLYVVRMGAKTEHRQVARRQRRAAAPS